MADVMNLLEDSESDRRSLLSDARSLNLMSRTVENDRRSVVLTRVTYASGKVSQYYAQSAGSSMITADVVGGCSSCSSEDGTYVFDTSGHVIKKQDARGYITQYTYAGSSLSSIFGLLKPPACDPQTDSAHCRLTVAALTAASPELTPVSLVTTYAYGNANWPDKPTLITTTSVANGSGTRQESLTYDVATGEVLVRSVTGWVSSAQSETHTTTDLPFERRFFPSCPR